MSALRVGGSSPRLRGAHQPPSVEKNGWGLIPASAGSTIGRTSDTILVTAHPRVCGEHRRSTSKRILLWGSSPRLRGARVDLGGGGEPKGLIPASAGSTWSPLHHAATA